MTILFVIGAAQAGPPPPLDWQPTCVGGVRRELRRLARADQKDRRTGHPDMEARDHARLTRAREIAAMDAVCSTDEALDLAVLLQHGSRRADHLAAWTASAWADREGDPAARQWVALTWDRYLVSGGELQWYGTQMRGEDLPDGSHRMCLIEIDPAATEAERVAVGRPLDVTLRMLYANHGLPAPEPPTLEGARADGLLCAPIAWAEELRPAP